MRNVEFYNGCWIVKNDKRLLSFGVYKDSQVPIILYKTNSEEMAKMWIDFKLIKAFRIDENEVRILYSYKGYEFLVTKNNLDPETGKADDYYDLQIACLSESEELNDRVIEAIHGGEADDNEDCLFYLFIRDTFDNQSCKDLV